MLEEKTENELAAYQHGNENLQYLSDVIQVLTSYPDRRDNLIQFIIENSTKLLCFWFNIRDAKKFFPDLEDYLIDFVFEHSDRFLSNWGEMKDVMQTFPKAAPRLLNVIFSAPTVWLRNWYDYRNASETFPNEERFCIQLSKDRIMDLKSKYCLEMAQKLFPSFKWEEVLFAKPLFEKALETNDLTFFSNWYVIKNWLTIFPHYAEKIFNLVKDNKCHYLQTWLDILVAKEYFPEHETELWDFIVSDVDKWFTCFFDFTTAKKVFDKKEPELVDIFIKKLGTVIPLSMWWLNEAADLFPNHMDKWSQVLIDHPSIGQSSRFDKSGLLKSGARAENEEKVEPIDAEFITPGVSRSRAVDASLNSIASAYQHHGLMGRGCVVIGFGVNRINNEDTVLAISCRVS